MTNRSRNAYLVLFTYLLASNGVEGRQWKDVINYDIIHESNIDVSRYELAIEIDPFLVPGEKAPSVIPTETVEPPYQWISASQEKQTGIPNLSSGNKPMLNEVNQSNKLFGSVSASQPVEKESLNQPIVETTAKPLSMPPSRAPTMPPIESVPLPIGTSNVESSHVESSNVELEGCREGLELYEVHLMDTWGDGWNEETKLTITGISDLDPLASDLPNSAMSATTTDVQGNVVVSITKTISLDSVGNHNVIDPLGKIFEANLKGGHHDKANVCLLPNRCYRVVVTGPREFLEENSWEIRSESSPETAEPLIIGSAPTGCTFSLPDENGHHFCENVCSEEILDQAKADAEAAANGKDEALNQNIASTAKTLIPKEADQVEQARPHVVVNEATGSSNGMSVLQKFRYAGGGQD